MTVVVSLPMKTATSRVVCRCAAWFVMAACCFTQVHAQSPALNASAPTDNRAPGSNLQAEADRNYAEKSYALSLDDYRRLLPSLPAKSLERTIASYRIAVALGQSQKWDDAFTAIDQFISAHTQEPLWQARGLYQRGLLLNLAPQQGYQVGKRIYRGTNYPHVDSSETPQNVNLQTDDQTNALHDFEAALKDYDGLPQEQRAAVASEKADLCFDLAKLLPAVQPWGTDANWRFRRNGFGASGVPTSTPKDDWKTAKSVDWRIGPAQPYNPLWPSPKKVLYLYARIPALNPSDTHRSVLAALNKALYIAQSSGQWERRDYQPPRGKPGDKDYWQGGYEPVQTIPYFFLDPVAILDQAASKYPSDEQAPQLRLIVAKWTENGGGYADALSRYRELLARYPHCRWADDVNAGIQTILTKSVTLSASGIQQVGNDTHLAVNSRNLKTLTFHAYSVPLETILTDPKILNNEELETLSFASVFGGPSAATKLGTQVAQWEETTNDHGDYAPIYTEVKPPLTKIGAYVIVAEGDGGKVRGATLMMISDLAVIRKTDKDNALAFVTDARSGQPVAGAGVVIRQVYFKGNDPKNGHQLFRIVASQGKTDAEGIYTAPLVRTNDTLQRVEVFASSPGSRYALTNNWGNFWYNAPQPDQVKGYVYTDRPVYRPSQAVYFRDVIAKPQSGGSDYAPLVDQPVQVEISDAKGQEIYNNTLTTNAFGSISWTLTLANGAPLGNYHVHITRDGPTVNGSTPIEDCGSTQFRVEEYKKPEFLVQVTPSSTQARFGDLVTAKIKARYYFGNPVIRGKVAYRVFRNEFYASYQFPQAYDWLYNSDTNGGYPNANAANGELVTQGTAETDANGEALVTFKAEKGTRDYHGDYAYTVMADVTDSSRRLISGEGILHVTNQQFYAFLNLPRAFAQEGDTVQAELRTINADQKPVSETGTLTVEKLLFDPKTGFVSYQTVHTQVLTTDTDGKAFTTWTSQTSGQYRISFKATDRYDANVEADAPFWIAGADLAPNSYRVGGITLLTDKTTYEQGETAHLLIVGDQPDDWVLLTQEAGDQILKHDVVHMTGRATTIDVPIVRADVPNFALAAVAMRDYQFYQWNQELFVPPTRQFMSMAVTGDKAEYKPGETGVFHVKTTDYLGYPIASEVSLAVTDASVYYIQKDYAADIRTFYYGDRRSVYVDAASSRDAQYGGSEESEYFEPKYLPHGFLLPDSGRLSANPSEYSTTYAGFRSYPISGYGYRKVPRMQLMNTETSVGMGRYEPVDNFAPSGGYVRLRGADENALGFNDGAIVANTADNSLSPRTSGTVVQFIRPKVRSNFADTAFWTPAVVTDPEDGTASVKVTFPDTLTTWKATARGTTANVLVGTDETSVVTNKHLLVRLESPRFFVERDQVTLSAIVMNTLKTAKTVRVSLAADRSLLSAPDAVRTISMPAGGEQRVDWTATVKGAGTADITMTAETDEESDAVRQSFPVLGYGVRKFIAGGGVMGDSQTTQSFTVTIPHDHKPGSSALLVQVNPSLAATVIDALPFLTGYPYGCIEQTLSRFVPTVLVASALRDAGVDLDTLHKRALAMQTRGAEPSPLGQDKETTNDTDQTGYTYPHGTPGVLKTPILAPEAQPALWYDNPIFDPEGLASMEQDGLSRLTSMQRGDGGFGWWPYSIDEDPYMTAYALYSLCAARDAGVTVPGDMIRRAANYLETHIKRRDDEPNIAVWATFAISRTDPSSATTLHVAQAMYQQRSKLSPYGEALLALTLHAQKRDDEASIVCRNLVDTARIDRENGTASWEALAGYWWYWYYDDTETNAWVLQALIAVDPQSELSPMLVKWLVRHKLGSGWETTKATAMVVGALMQYVRLTHELDPDYTVTVALGDKIKRSFTVNRDNALLFDNAFLVPDSLLTDGAQTVTLTKSGTGRCYFASSLQYFTTEEQIKGAGTELKVQRRYYRLTPKLARRKDWTGDAYNALDYDRTELGDGAVLKSGDLIEVELILDAKNDYDYVAFEDMKPAGCEPVDLRSGERYGDGLCSDMELRDTKTAFFVDHLPQGTRVLRYRLRAEVPGAFHALPCNAYAMYAPGVRALSNSQHFTIEDAPTLANAAPASGS